MLELGLLTIRLLTVIQVVDVIWMNFVQLYKQKPHIVVAYYSGFNLSAAQCAVLRFFGLGFSCLF
jgi:hypothetical protein